MAGVANIGADRNWTGSHFDQANWYAFGRLAWDPELSRAETVANDWVRMTFSNDSALRGGSRGCHDDGIARSGGGLHDALGTCIIKWPAGHHYGPGPWVGGGPRADWTSVYFNKADAVGHWLRSHPHRQ